MINKKLKCADAILKLRRKLGLTQVEFAKKISQCGKKITQAAIANYEGGIRKPHVKIACYMVRLCKENNIDLTLEDLLCDPED